MQQKKTASIITAALIGTAAGYVAKSMMPKQMEKKAKKNMKKAVHSAENFIDGMKS